LQWFFVNLVNNSPPGTPCRYSSILKTFFMKKISPRDSSLSCVFILLAPFVLLLISCGGNNNNKQETVAESKDEQYAQSADADADVDYTKTFKISRMKLKAVYDSALRQKVIFEWDVNLSTKNVKLLAFVAKNHKDYARQPNTELTVKDYDGTFPPKFKTSNLEIRLKKLLYRQGQELMYDSLILNPSISTDYPRYIILKAYINTATLAKEFLIGAIPCPPGRPIGNDDDPPGDNN
jgi:hypothetical protein